MSAVTKTLTTYWASFRWQRNNCFSHSFVCWNTCFRTNIWQSKRPVKFSLFLIKHFVIQAYVKWSINPRTPRIGARYNWVYILSPGSCTPVKSPLKSTGYGSGCHVRIVGMNIFFPHLYSVNTLVCYFSLCSTLIPYYEVLLLITLRKFAMKLLQGEFLERGSLTNTRCFEMFTPFSSLVHGEEKGIDMWFLACNSSEEQLQCSRRNNLARLAFQGHNLEPCILSTDQTMIPDRNAIDARTQGFMIKDEMLLISWKLPQSYFTHYTLLEMLDVFSLSLLPVALQYSRL